MPRSHRPLFTAGVTAGACILAVGALASACLDRPLEPIDVRSTSTYKASVDNGTIDKIDILISVDDSKSMADKQAILALAVPQLIESLVNPACLPDDPQSGLTRLTPDSPTAECPENMHREFDPILDIHVGVIASSLGLGETGIETNGKVVACVDRKAHLLTQDELQSEVPTYDGRGFLAWDPEGRQSPAGDNDLGAFIDKVGALVEGVGQEGCGYEASLESWYRFLVDPAPPAKMDIVDGKAVPVGVDEELLAQRAAFLRPDSLVAVVMLTDENDCSMKAGYGYLTGRTGTGDVLGINDLQPRAICATDPGSPCCATCGAGVPEECGADPSCDTPTGPPDGNLVNLNCFQQKRRLGIDLLQPTDRYVQGLTEAQIPGPDGEPVDNPLFIAEDGTRRPQDRVFLAGIVGVPYQLVARNPANLGEGLMTHEELDEARVYDNIVGDPSAYVDPLDAHMVESPTPRPGLPTASSGTLDPIHGHEHSHGRDGNGDLEYACIFDLPADYQEDCTTADCDCKNPADNPLCRDDQGNYATTQLRAKAYPGLRHIEVLQGLQSQGIVGSICAKQLADPSQADFGYQPAIGALVARLAVKLQPSCLPRRLTPDREGQVACLVLEGRKTSGACSCDGVARSEVGPEQQGALTALSTVVEAKGYDCFCRVDQLEGDALNACQTDLSDAPTTDAGPADGWCYVDAQHG
ncbi:MAG: hypothetical protein KC731_25905, partial [Myxococcales bacterium]|nr:hypothetical protein [Myxococcales bacterium]